MSYHVHIADPRGGGSRGGANIHPKRGESGGRISPKDGTSRNKSISPKSGSISFQGRRKFV